MKPYSERTLKNLKPYRSKKLKEEAKANAKRGSDGAYHSSVPVFFHK